VNVVNLRVSAAQLLEKIQATAKSSSHVVIIPTPDKHSMAGMMTFLQAVQCVQKGQIVGKPIKNEHDDWELTMERTTPSGYLKIKVFAECDGANVVRVIVKNEEGGYVQI